MLNTSEELTVCSETAAQILTNLVKAVERLDGSGKSILRLADKNLPDDADSLVQKLAEIIVFPDDETWRILARHKIHVEGRVHEETSGVLLRHFVPLRFGQKKLPFVELDKR